MHISKPALAAFLVFQLALATLLVISAKTAPPASQDALSLRSLSLVDSEGKTRIFLSVEDDGRARVTLLGVKGMPSADLQVDSSGNPSLDLNGPLATLTLSDAWENSCANSLKIRLSCDSVEKWSSLRITDSLDNGIALQTGLEHMTILGLKDRSGSVCTFSCNDYGSQVKVSSRGEGGDLRSPGFYVSSSADGASVSIVKDDWNHIDQYADLNGVDFFRYEDGMLAGLGRILDPIATVDILNPKPDAQVDGADD